MTNQQGAPAALRFTKKPVTIEAIQWTGKNLREVITFTDGPPDTRPHHAGMAWDDYRDLVARDGLKIYTLEGKMLASPGDWIIRGVKGELYPCKPDIFEATYSPAALAAGQATAAQQGAAYAAQDSEHQMAIMQGERNASLDAYSRVVSITSAESRLYERAFTSGWDRRDRLASYGQAPAQAAPAAVAGSSDDLVTRDSAMRAIEHVAQHNSASREREAVKMLATAPTAQPSPAAQGDALDAERLDWLLLRISGAEFRRIGVHYSGNARRADVDAARKQGANHD